MIGICASAWAQRRSVAKFTDFLNRVGCTQEAKWFRNERTRRSTTGISTRSFFLRGCQPPRGSCGRGMHCLRRSAPWAGCSRHGHWGREHDNRKVIVNLNHVLHGASPGLFCRFPTKARAAAPADIAAGGARVRVCSKRCAPSFDHRTCWRFERRLPTTTMTVDFNERRRNSFAIAPPLGVVRDHSGIFGNVGVELIRRRPEGLYVRQSLSTASKVAAQISLAWIHAPALYRLNA